MLRTKPDILGAPSKEKSICIMASPPSPPPTEERMSPHGGKRDERRRRFSSSSVLMSKTKGSKTSYVYEKTQQRPGLEERNSPALASQKETEPKTTKSKCGRIPPQRRPVFYEPGLGSAWGEGIRLFKRLLLLYLLAQTHESDANRRFFKKLS